MPQNNTYLSNLDKERKRLIKIELSSIDALKESFNQVEEQIDDVNSLFNDAVDMEDLVANAIDDFNDALDNLRVVANLLEAKTEDYDTKTDNLEDATTKLRDLYQMKTEDVVNDFDKNADALGIKAGQIPERNLLVESNIEAQKITDRAFRLINDSQEYIKEAQKLINDYNL